MHPADMANCSQPFRYSRRQSDVSRVETRSARIVNAILSRVQVYGAILAFAAWWMLWIPGRFSLGPMEPLNANESRLEAQIRGDIRTLAGQIGERNVDFKPERLGDAARFIERSFRTANCEPRSQWYKINNVSC